MKNQDNNQQELLEEKQIQLEELATKNCILKVVAGSHAYGTNIPSSDWDERGIFVDDISRIILPFEKIEQVQYRKDDVVLYELSKYMPLLLAQNPNVIELIWTDEKDVLFKNTNGQMLIDNRAEFLSKQIRDSYVGYAQAQLKRIKGHNKWINNPQPEKEPEQKDFTSVVWNYTNNREFNKKVPFDNFVAVYLGDNHYSLWEMDKLKIEKKCWIDKRGNPNPIDKHEFDKINTNNIPPDLIVKVNKNLFESHHTNWKMYWNWKKNRNEKRSVLEEQFGYDVKHAMHLIRLLRSGLDILENGIVPVKRPDKDYLMDIRNGKYTYEEIVAESEKLTNKVDEVSKKTKLPDEPNYLLAKEMMLEIYQNQWNLSIKDKQKIASKISR